MNLINEFFSYFRRRKKVDNVSPPNEGRISALLKQELDAEDIMLNNVYMSQLTENVKESISVAAEHGLIEATEIDEEGEFIYNLTDKGMKFNEVLAKINSTEAQSGVIDIDKEDEWVVEVLMAMGINMREYDEDEGEMI